MNSLSRLFSLLFGFAKEEREQSAIASQKERNHFELCLLLGHENGDCIYEIIRSEKHPYDVDQETRRATDIKTLGMFGVGFEQIKKLVEQGREAAAVDLIGMKFWKRK